MFILIVEVLGFADRGIAVDSANNANGTWEKKVDFICHVVIVGNCSLQLNHLLRVIVVK